jgi:L-ascorbate metabolism protein UlaG (beta-lactamase superfamily)
MLIPALLKDESLIRDADRLLPDQHDFHLWWLGQSGYLMQWNGKRILIDPYLSDSLTRKYALTAKPHVRMSERVIDPSLLTGISLVSSSHNHTDHLDGETLIPLMKNNPGIHIIIPEANREFVAERIKCNPDLPEGLNDGGQVSIDGFTFHGIPAKHNTIDRDAKGNCRFMGYIIRFGDWLVYHSGDTLWYDEMVELVKPFSVDLALLPINGNDPARGVAGNLDTREAAHLAKAIGAKMVIPGHYDMFHFNTADPADFARECDKINQPYRILKHGERWDSSLL